MTIRRDVVLLCTKKLSKVCTLQGMQSRSSLWNWTGSETNLFKGDHSEQQVRSILVHRQQCILQNFEQVMTLICYYGRVTAWIRDRPLLIFKTMFLAHWSAHCQKRWIVHIHFSRTVNNDRLFALTTTIGDWLFALTITIGDWLFALTSTIGDWLFALTTTIGDLLSAQVNHSNQVH